MAKDRALVKLGKMLDRYDMAAALETVDDPGCRALALMLRGREPITGVYEADFMKCSLANLCHRTGVTYKVATQAYKDWKRTEAVMKAAERLPSIVESIAADAENRVVTCQTCEGAAVIRLKIAGEPDVEKRCLACEGVGTVVKSGDASARKQILEMMELAGRGVMNVDARGANVTVGRGESMEETLKASRVKRETDIEGVIDGAD